MRTFHRARLGLLVMAMGLLTLTGAVGAAIAVHGHFETQDSLVHWRGRLQRSADRRVERHVRRLEAALDDNAERFRVSVGMFVVSGAVTWLGVWGLRRRGQGDR